MESTTPTGTDGQSDVEPESPSRTPEAERRPMGKDDYLVPGPTADSNEGLARWGLSWLIFSILLMLLMLGITVACFFIGSWLNLG